MDTMETKNSLGGKIAVVTGSSRGIGRGIALTLGAQGAIVYVTGRSQAEGDHSLPGTIHATAEAITAAGGVGIAVACDHGDDAQVAALFARIGEEHGRIDLLVNNAAYIPVECLNPPPFWTKPVKLADQITVGLRSAYVSTYYAAPLLIAASNALVINISYYGAVSYHLDPAYGATKGGLDKMTSDMAKDFEPFGVSVMSVWPGPTLTEMAVSLLSQIPDSATMMESFETPEFSGRVVASLYNDPDRRTKSGTVVIGAEAALEYQFTDINGKQPPVLRDALGSPLPFA